MSTKLNVTVFLILVILNADLATSNKSEPHESVKLFNTGVDAFLAARWNECVVNFEGALASVRGVQEDAVDCHRGCADQAHAPPAIAAENIENLRISEKLLQKSFCLRRCQRDVAATADKWKAYEYLQHCYYQLQQPEEAASAAFTVLRADPEHGHMRTMLEFYATLPGIQMSSVVDREAPSFTEVYNQGVAAYDDKDYVFAIDLLEESLTQYTKDEEVCRAACALDEPQGRDWLLDHNTSIIDHVTKELLCKRRCPSTLAAVNRKRTEDVLPNHYKYLHLAYFKVQKSCEAIASYLLLKPDDESMKMIRDNFESMITMLKMLKKSVNISPPAEVGCSVPRAETSKYALRVKYESQLLHFIEKEGEKEGGEGTSPDGATQDDDEFSNEIRREVRKEAKHNVIGEPGAKEGTEEGQQSVELKEIRDSYLQNTRLLKTDVELKGPNRFLVEGIASEEECQILMQMAKDAHAHGNSHISNKVNPWSTREEVQAVNLPRASMMAHFGVLDHGVVEKYYEIADRAKAYLERHFKLEGKLFHEYANLICRSVLPTSEWTVEMPPSHALHCDNCHPRADGSCHKADFHYWRDYTSLIYLNDNFEGAELYFTRNLSESGFQSEVKARCGLSVGFSSGHENIHAVRPLLSGQRCAILQLYTLTPEHDDKLRVLAQTVRDRSWLHGAVPDYDVVRLDTLKEFANFRQQS